MAFCCAQPFIVEAIYLQGKSSRPHVPAFGSFLWVSLSVIFSPATLQTARSGMQDTAPASFLGFASSASVLSQQQCGPGALPHRLLAFAPEKTVTAHSGSAQHTAQHSCFEMATWAGLSNSQRL